MIIITTITPMTMITLVSRMTMPCMMIVRTTTTSTASAISGKRTGNCGGGDVTMPQVNPHWARFPLHGEDARPTVRAGEVANVNEVTRERAQSSLANDHIERMVQAYEQFKEEPGLTRVATLEEICAKDGNLSIPLYVVPPVVNGVSDKHSAEQKRTNLDGVLAAWLQSSNAVRESLETLWKSKSAE